MYSHRHQVKDLDTLGGPLKLKVGKLTCAYFWEHEKLTLTLVEMMRITTINVVGIFSSKKSLVTA